ncbi:MAG TPA: WYL domain-containing protein [Anaerohalosphaeraceae bacterium]|nr:WYL domain-containing protein [Anaerohalosphaeraceae bacterium]HOT72366.1 WYL domain-containing protein [Anaerohalosphaeraceae bacterium]HQG05873.1 WYL domain-containing protein [Anaerohalosphaeraceae bacterium]HQI07155.1 WYL domain-containing protein [Anaerohalosphaeraceae bacterium]HQJ67400.1 WYL domain-containing protein [Anaerohalosphaeraceae bacterium]
MSRGQSLIRQWNLLKILQSFHFGISADELAHRLECSKRQVLRDLKILCELGFPITFEERLFGKRFWKLHSRFIETGQMLFSPTELISLYLSQKLLSPLSGTLFGEGIATLMDKIKAMLSPRTLDYFATLEQHLLVKTTALNTYAAHDKIIRLLARAVQDSHIIRLRYRSTRSSEPYETLYHPYGMVFFDGDLYCIGWMERYEEIRTLKISRILSAEPTGHTFQRPPDFSLVRHTQDSFGIFSKPPNPRQIRIQLDGWAAANVRETRRHPSQTIIRDTGDTLIVQFEITPTDELLRWILSFGSRAKVLSPPSLIRQVKNEIKQMTHRYERRQEKQKN